MCQCSPISFRFLSRCSARAARPVRGRGFRSTGASQGRGCGGQTANEFHDEANKAGGGSIIHLVPERSGSYSMCGWDNRTQHRWRYCSITKKTSPTLDTTPLSIGFRHYVGRVVPWDVDVDVLEVLETIISIPGGREYGLKRGKAERTTGLALFSYRQVLSSRSILWSTAVQSYCWCTRSTYDAAGQDADICCSVPVGDDLLAGRKSELL